MALRIKVQVDGSQVKSGLDQAKAEARKFAQDIKQEFAAAFAIGAFMEGVHAAVEKFGNIGDLAERFNVSAEALQKLAFAGEQSGTSLESVAKGINKMRLAMAEAASKSGEARDVFNAVGISTEQLQKGEVSAEEAFYRVADAVKHASNESEQLSIVTAVFGNRIGGELVPMLSLGRSGMEDLAKGATVLSGDAVGALKQMDDSSKALKSTFSAAFGYIAIVLHGFVEVVRSIVTTVVAYWVTVGSATEHLGKAIFYGLTGRFGQARNEFKQLVSDIQAGMESVGDTWKELPGRVVGGEKSPEGDGAKRKILLTDEEKKDLEERAKLQKEIADAERKAEEDKMSAWERVNALTARHLELMKEAMQVGWDTTAGLQKRLEAARLLEQIERDKKAVAEQEKKDTEDIARMEREYYAAKEANDSKGETTQMKAERLRKKEIQLRQEAEQAPDIKGYHEKTMEAEKVRGELIDMALQKDKKQFTAPTVDSLRAIGGGSGGVGPSADPQLLEIRRSNSILTEIRDAVRQRNSGSNSNFTIKD